jgi:hypothetical protein
MVILNVVPNHAPLSQEVASAQACGPRVLQYRLLWLRLSAQTRDTGTACCYTHGFLLVYLCVTLMLASYESLNSEAGLDQECVSAIIEAAVIAGCLIVFCDSAHRASAHVSADCVLVSIHFSNSDNFPYTLVCDSVECTRVMVKTALVANTYFIWLTLKHMKFLRSMSSVN